MTAGLSRTREVLVFEVAVTRAGLVYRRPGAMPAEALRFRPAPAAAPGARVVVEVSHAEAPALPTVQPDPSGESFQQVVVVANGMGAFEAEQLAQAALRRLPLDAPLHYLRATLLLTLDHEDEAEREARRAVYLDSSLAIAHFLLGTILRKRGAPGALRAFRNARDICAARPSDEGVRAGAGERMGALHSAAAAEMRRLEVALV